MDMRQTVLSTCLHDCLSQCVLEVERLDARTIGRVRGAKSQPTLVIGVAEIGMA